MAVDVFGIVGRLIASVYHVESVVAEGGFGVVYRARHGGFRAPVALKCLKVPQHLGHEQRERFIESFRAEGEVMFRLSASIPAVARPLHVDVMTAPNGAFVPFMVLEWLDGETLDAIVRARTARGKPPLALADALALLEPVAHALERAHRFRGPAGEESIAHCDLKPENVFIARAGGEASAKILDFGVAKVRSAATRAAEPPSGSGSSGEDALFTPAYGAPEQWDPRTLGETGPWTDVWGLALTLVETVAGRPVIAGDVSSIRRQVLDVKKRPTPRMVGVVVSDEVEAVFARALAVHPRERYADAGAFWRVLRAAEQSSVDVPLPPGLEIPDLLPLDRKPSGTSSPQLPGASELDFDDGSAGIASGLSLDLPPSGPPGPRVPAAADPSSSGDDTRPPGVAAVSPSPSGTPPDRGAVSARPGAPTTLTTTAGAAPAAAGKAYQGAPVRKPLLRRLMPGAGLVLASVVLTFLDRVYAAATGEVFSFGPLRTSYVAAALLVLGLALAVRELFED